jgi:hypothetical protein
MPIHTDALHCKILTAENRRHGGMINPNTHIDLGRVEYQADVRCFVRDFQIVEQYQIVLFWEPLYEL